MSKEAKNYKKFLENLKLNLSYNGLINQYEIFKIENKKDKTGKDDEILREEKEKIDDRISNPLCYLLNGKENLDRILNDKKINVLEYIYLNRYVIHNILYKEDEIIEIISDYLSNFKDYYYLYLLIKAEPELNNYNYDLSFVQNAVGFQNESLGKLEKIIKAKIVLTLIKTYKDQNDEDQNDEKQDYLSMENSCIKNIDDNKKVLEKYKINIDLENLSDDNIHINEIYIDILQYLIINQKLDESDETSTLLNELDIKNLRINKDIFEALKKVLTEEHLYNYKIENFDDLFESKKKLTFYYSLFENILKDSIYIYEIPFLLEQRKNIIKIIKENSLEFYSQIKKGKNDDKINKLKKILGYFSIGFDFYYKKGHELKELKKKESTGADNNYSGNNNQSNNSINSNSNMISRGDSNSSIKNSNSSSAKNPLENESFKNKGSQGSSYYDESGEKIYEKNYDKAYLILSESEFNFTIKYIKEEDKADITFDKITYKDIINNNNVQINIDEVNNLNAEDGDYIDFYYERFKKYLEEINMEISQRYKKEKEIKIIMKIKLQQEKENKLIVDSYFTIKDDIKGNESNYSDKNFLESNIHTGLGCLIDEII